MRFSPLFLMFGIMTGAGPSAPTTVSHVDLSRYVGTWYEIASIPQIFQRGCTATQAEYALRDDGKVAVKNSCRKDSLTGPLSVAEGVARVVDQETNAKLKVQFQWPFEGDYWILDLDQDYRWAVVGSPDRDALWVLSRTRHLDRATFASILVRAETVQGYDVSRLQMTLQPDD